MTEQLQFRIVIIFLKGAKMSSEQYTKIDRVLTIYSKLVQGKMVNKQQEADYYKVDARTIQRDIDDIRTFLDNARDKDVINHVVYDRKLKSYKLEESYSTQFSNSEVLAICKILLASRAFIKEEIDDMLDKMITNCVPKQNKKYIKELISNELFHYVELQHKTSFMNTMWEIGEAINQCNMIEISYERKYKPALIKRKVKPVALLFSEYYFYLTAYIDDSEIAAKLKEKRESFPTIYRIDRIKSFKILDQKFKIPYADRFEEGEFRKRIQFMQGGKLTKIKFKYKGASLDAILDRLPTAVILDEDADGVIIKVEGFGKGIEMWLRSQGNLVEIL